MSIPAAFLQFKSAGVYRLVYDKSTILNLDTEIMRLVVGYSAQGPFNVPVLVRSISEFKALFGEPSKSLEKRGVYFHKIALQSLLEGPILCLNLKRFANETVQGATVDTTFNPDLTPGASPIDVVELNVEDIYDTTRFWNLSANKLADIKDTTGRPLDGYIALSATNTKNTSGTFFLRKAAGQKVAGYNITVNDWYKDSGEEVPEFLQDKLNNKISDFFAEIYFFKGQFTPDQVLSSSTLKNYFQAVESDGNVKLELRPYVTNAYGDAIDTLDALFNEPTSGALTHYVGSLIPYFKDKQGVYQALDIIVNIDVDTNNIMMNFNVDALEEGLVNIDLSGRARIATAGNGTTTLAKLFGGTATTTVLSNVDSPVICDTISFDSTFQETKNEETARRITGNYYATAIVAPAINRSTSTETPGTITIADLKGGDSATGYTIKVPQKYWADALNQFGITEVDVNSAKKYCGGIYCASLDLDSLIIPDQNIVGITNYSKVTEGEDEEAVTYIEYKPTTTFAIAPVTISATSKQINTGVESVYGSSVTFIPLVGWSTEGTYDGSQALISTTNSSLVGLLAGGDCLLANDGSTDADSDGTTDATDGYYDNVFVQEVGSFVGTDGKITYFVKLSGKAMTYTNGDVTYIVRLDSSLNQETGKMSPVYLEGYTYQNAKPASTSMYDKQKWQDFILSTLTDYKGIRTGLLNKADCDYRYIVDTFESFVTAGCKNVLSFLSKEKQSAFSILNFPAVRTFVKCPYTSFTDNKGVFNAEYVVKGFNPKKSHTVPFTLPSDSEGASYCAFYTPVKFSDGYVDTMVPSAGLVSNLFIEKYRSRQPYYIVAGPNYGAISASEMSGPDYNYSREELNILEPFGVNCLVYRPGFGTFINANQTAKQTPVSSLSSVNVRELVIYLQDEIEKLLQQYQWDFNNQTVRNKIKDKADVICSRVQANGGIQDFVNIMDESNNTPEIIDNEMAVLSTHIEPGRGMGKMIHELTLYRTGQMRAAISEA